MCIMIHILRISPPLARSLLAVYWVAVDMFYKNILN